MMMEESRNRDMQAVLAMARRHARLDSPVLIEGESGTGKELLARAIHALSSRSSGPFLKIDCAGSGNSLVLADGGTLLLDEVGSAPPALQEKIVSAIEYKEYWPAGAERAQPVNVRAIATTSRDLAALVREGRFRTDLYYRLNVVHLVIPPLRRRAEDIPHLVRRFLLRLAAEAAAPAPRIDPGAMARLLAYHWPGNVRELQNALRFAFGEAGLEGPILPQHLPPAISGILPPPPEGSLLDRCLAAVEQAALREAITAWADGDRTRAAKILGISRAALYKKLARYPALWKELRDGGPA